MRLARPSCTHSASLLLALAAVVVWGATFTLSKQLLAALSPLCILWVRFVVGYAALWLFYPRRLTWQGGSTEARLALMGLFGVTLYFCGENFALVYGGAGMVSVVVCVSPVLTALLPWLIGRGGSLGVAYWVGFVLAMGGVLLTVSGGELQALGGAWQGAALAAAGALSWALYTLIAQALPAHLNRLAVTRRVFFWGLVTMAPLCLRESGTWAWGELVVWSNAWRLLALGMVAGAGCYAAWGFAVAHLGGVRTSLLLYLNPVVGVVTAALVLGEKLTGWIALGVAFTLAGVALSARGRRRA